MEFDSKIKNNMFLLLNYGLRFIEKKIELANLKVD